jgi:hypothetical protein
MDGDGEATGPRPMNTWMLHIWLRRYLVVLAAANDSYLDRDKRAEMSYRSVATRAFRTWRAYRDSVKRS